MGPAVRPSVGTLPKWLRVAAVLLLVALLGIVDYATGDYSILVFYMVPVALGAWFVGLPFAALVAVASGIVRFYADSQSYVNLSFARYLNIAGDVLFFSMTAGMAALVRSMLGKSDRAGRRVFGKECSSHRTE